MSALPPKYAQAAAIIRAEIASGALLPGSPAPSGAALARVTGFSSLTCRKALTLLIMEGSLRPGPSPNARPRVAGPGPAGPDSAARAAALSGALADRRRAAGRTQLELAALTRYSVTTIGHAETGRVWLQSAGNCSPCWRPWAFRARLHESRTRTAAETWPQAAGPAARGRLVAAEVVPGPAQERFVVAVAVRGLRQLVARWPARCCRASSTPS
jgi:hypothetical protein